MMVINICVALIVVITVLILFIYKKIFVIKVNGSSMEPTYSNNDYLIGYRSRSITVGDVVVARIDYKGHPTKCITVIKRIDYIVYENSRARLFLTGDNKGHSIDSRDCNFGTIPIDRVVGKVIYAI